MSELKKKTIHGVFWSFLQRFSNQGISFVVSIFLARTLLPEDFGLVGMVTIFLTLGILISESGLSSSLIRSEDVTENDYTIVFVINLLLSIILYGLLYFTAPFIAIFFKQSILTGIIRVAGCSVIIKSLSAVQTARLTKFMKFNLITFSEIPSALISGLLGIWMAHAGYGLWSLVYMSLIQSTLSTIQIWIHSGWIPSRSADFKRLRYHFQFGYKLTLSAILNAIFLNAYTVVIGKFFSPAQVGFYNRATALTMLPVRNISQALNVVTFPMFSSIQNDDVRLKAAYKKLMQQVVFWIAPILVGMAVLAEPLIVLIFTDRWLPSVPYFQILAFTGIMYPLHVYNLNILKVKGRSDLFLRLEVIKQVMVILGIGISLPFGIYGLLYAQVLFTLLAFFINGYYSGRFLNYPVAEQLKDILPILGIAMFMGCCVLIIKILLAAAAVWQVLLITSLSGILLYFGMAYLVNLSVLTDLKQLFQLKKS